MVTALNCNGHNFGRVGPLLDDARNTLNSLSSWQTLHTYHGVNSAAHGLAKAAIRQVINVIWIKEIYSCICDIVLLEQYPLFLI